MIKVTKETTELEGGTLSILDDFLNLFVHVRSTTLTTPDNEPTPETSDCLFQILKTFAAEAAKATSQEELDNTEKKFARIHSALMKALMSTYIAEVRLHRLHKEEDTEDDRGE